MSTCGTERGRFPTRLRTPAPRRQGRGVGGCSPACGLAGVALSAQTPLPGGTWLEAKRSSRLAGS